MDRPPEKELIERARSGDGEAYAALVRAHQQIAFRTAWLICGNSSEAEDVIQESFIKAWRTLGRFRSGSPFKPWLLTIVANEARSRGRRSARRSRLMEQLAADERLSGGAVPPPEAAVLRDEDAREVLLALGALGERHREIISLRYLLDLSEAEIAAVLGIRRGTVKSRLSRALERLRELTPVGEAS